MSCAGLARLQWVGELEAPTITVGRQRSSDSPSGQLIAAAAAGLEEEVRQGVHITVGRGFAGRIAAERRPVILDLSTTPPVSSDAPGSDLNRWVVTCLE